MKKIAEHIRTDDYRYNLPVNRIAKYPLENRDHSKLLIYQNGTIEESVFLDFPNRIQSDSVIVRNNTRVIQARLEFQKETGARIEIFCLEPSQPADYESNLSKITSSSWYCLIGNARKWKSEILQVAVHTPDGEIRIQAKKMGKTAGKEEIQFTWEPKELSLSEILDHFGQTPIPPYLERESEPEDKIRYQTIYAKNNGSVAAPTAGLHFTKEVEKELRVNKIVTSEVTLHVGAGTFKPIKSETIATHKMHTEHLIVKRDDIHHILNYDKFGITAIGTTSLRTLESLYWVGYLIHKKKISIFDTIHIDQWLPYRSDSSLTRRQALLEILLQMSNNQIESIEFSTGLIIIPGYTFRMVERLVTNFHQPGSTLLLLVAAFVGTDWEKIYQFALDHEYRFLSYGDSSLLYGNQQIQ